MPVPDLIHHLAAALANPQPPPLVTTAPCQEVVIEDVDLYQLPILLHLPQDAGHYIASNVVITADPDLGRNMCYHRLLRLDKTRFAARIVERRGTYNAMSKTSTAICRWPSASAFRWRPIWPLPCRRRRTWTNWPWPTPCSPTPLVKCLTNDLYVPADAEIVLEGRITHQTGQ